MVYLINYLIDSILTLSLWQYLVNLAIVATGRSLDILSTWYVSPTLKLEKNVLMKNGWKSCIIFNIMASLLLAMWLGLSLVVFVASTLIAANNLGGAWRTRTMGEEQAYELEMRLAKKADPKTVYFSIFSSGILIAVVGAIVMYFSNNDIIFWVGAGIVGYGLASIIVYLRYYRRTKRGFQK